MAAAQIVIPAGAAKAEDGSYHYTDAQGKKWIYCKTPFGVARAEDQPVDRKPLETAKDVKATEDGEFIRFERPGPFGTYKWQRRKTELDEMEQAVWERQKARAARKQD